MSSDWIIIERVGPKSNDRCPYKKQKWRRPEKGPREVGGRERSYAA